MNKCLIPISLGELYDKFSIEKASFIERGAYWCGLIGFIAIFPITLLLLTFLLISRK